MKNFTFLNVFVLIAGALIIAGCNRSTDPDDHEDMEQVVILDRSAAARTVIATWTHDDGWDVASLPDLNLGGNRMSLTVEIYDHQDEMITLDGDEYYVQYGLSQGAPTGVIDISRNDLFHGDHVYIYPLAIGTTQIEFALFHVDHADGYTEPIGITVVE